MGKEIIFNTFSAISKFNEIGGNEMMFRSLEEPTIEVQEDLILEEVEEIEEGLDENNLLKVLDGIGDTIVVVSGLAHKLGFDTKEIMDIINESNFSKFCENEHDANLSVQWYINNDTRYYDVHWELIGDFYVIKGKKSPDPESYKILKGIHFVGPEEQLKALIEEKTGVKYE